MFDSYIKYHARQSPRSVAIRTLKYEVSFETFDNAIDRVALRLIDLSINQSDLVSVEHFHPVRHWVIMMALSRIGIASACAADTKATFRLVGSSKQTSQVPFFHVPDAWFLDPQSYKAELPTVPRSSDSLGRVLLSSGTTGQQKRIGLSWKLIDQNTRNAVIAYGPVSRRPWHFEVPIDSVFGFTVPIAAWANGQAVSMRDTTEPILDVLTKLAPGFLAVVPFVLKGILGKLPKDSQPIPGMRIVCTGGLLPSALVRETRLRLSPDLRSVYGASECGAATILNADLLEHEPNAAGYPMPGVVVSIVDESGTPVAIGVQGHVRIHSPRVVGQYLDGDPTYVFRQDGFYPGDFGRLRADGLLIIEGRTNDVLNIGGRKISALLIEDVVGRMLGMLDVAAFAVPTEDGINELWLALVLDAGYELDEVAVRIERELPDTPPMHVFTLRQIPRNAMGKIQKLELSEAALRMRAGNVTGG